MFDRISSPHATHKLKDKLQSTETLIHHPRRANLSIQYPIIISLSQQHGETSCDEITGELVLKIFLYVG